jgi:FKBP-type peptidyl-prolyl cis-trans isomerase
MNKNLIIGLVAVIVLIGGVYYFSQADEVAKTAGGSSTAALSSETNNQTNFDIQGMKIEILQQGTGEAVKNGDKVTVNYVGTLEDGTKFDSSIDRGQPFVFTPGEGSVIKGWELGVVGMKVGEKRKLTIPPEMAYGSQGAGGVIPPNATLTFEIDLLAIN